MKMKGCETETGKLRRLICVFPLQEFHYTRESHSQDQKEFRCIESNEYKYERTFQVAVLSVSVYFITCFHTDAIPYWQKTYLDLVGHVFSIVESKILIPSITWVLADVYSFQCVTWVNAFQPFFHGRENYPTTLTFPHSLWGRLNTADIPEEPDFSFYLRMPFLCCRKKFSSRY